MQISDTQWRIIEELSKGDKTPTELPRALGITMPSIHVQLKELLGKKLILKTEDEKGKTRPYTKYSLGKGFAYITFAVPGKAERMFVDTSIVEKLRKHNRRDIK